MTRLQLFAQAAGFCQNPTCLRDLFIELSSGAIHIGEMAHIIAATEAGPRGEGDIDLDDRASFDNVVLLCPSCHSMVDKAPLDFPVDELHRWKDRHAQRIREAIGAQSYSSRADARAAISPLLAQNRQIHEQYGPEAPGASSPESEMPLAWHRKIVESILPNSRAIIAILDVNHHLLTEDEMVTVERLRQHIDDLAARHVLEMREPYRARFPRETEDLFS